MTIKKWPKLDSRQKVRVRSKNCRLWRNQMKVFPLLFPCLVFSLCQATNLTADILGPTGIYVLSSAQDNPSTVTDERLSNMRDYDFVDGYTLRMLWQDVDLGDGVYDFSAIDAAITQLQSNQHATKLNLELLVLGPPQYIQDQATETWEHFKSGVVPVPWDPALQHGHANLIEALASHEVFDANTGQLMPLAQHSALEVTNASVPGINGIRDNFGSTGLTKLVDLPSYDRQLFVDTVAASVGRTRAAFDEKFGFLGYFSMNDGEDSAFGESLNEALLDRLMTDFNNPGQPSLGLFQELLSDAQPNPAGGLGANLLAVSDETYIMFQALTSWLMPFTGEGNVNSMNPATGIEFAYETYDAKFFEIYISDVDGAVNGAVDSQGNPLIDDLRFWHDLLASAQQPGDLNGDGLVDASDLAFWQTSFGNTTDGQDFLAWQQQAAQASQIAVPEVNSLLMLVLAITSGLAIRPSLSPYRFH